MVIHSFHGSFEKASTPHTYLRIINSFNTTQLHIHSLPPYLPPQANKQTLLDTTTYMTNCSGLHLLQPR